MSVGPAGVELTTSRTRTRCSTNWTTGRGVGLLVKRWPDVLYVQHLIDQAIKLWVSRKTSTWSLILNAWYTYWMWLVWYKLCWVHCPTLSSTHWWTPLFSHRETPLKHSMGTTEQRLITFSKFWGNAVFSPSFSSAGKGQFLTRIF